MINPPYYACSTSGAGSNVTLAKEISLVVVSPFSVTVNLNTASVLFTMMTIFLSSSNVTGLADEPAFLYVTTASGETLVTFNAI